MPSGDYYYDGWIVYRSSYTQPYNHPDKSYYQISPYQQWQARGATFEHTQIDAYNSNSIINTPAWAVGAGIGAAVGGLADGVPGAVVGAIVGAAVGALFASNLGRIADENGNIWVVMDFNPPYENLSTWWAPCYAYVFHRIQVGPYAATNYDYFPNAC